VDMTCALLQGKGRDKWLWANAVWTFISKWTFLQLLRVSRMMWMPSSAIDYP
jgi:hypothetical protein